MGHPAAQFSWIRADKILLHGEFETFGSTSVLTITPSADSDFTSYTCIACNIIGEDSKTPVYYNKPVIYL